MVTHRPLSFGVGDVPDLPQEEAEVGIELTEHVVLPDTLTRPDQLLHQQTELLPLHEGLPVGEVGAGHTDGIDLVLAGGQAELPLVPHSVVLPYSSDDPVHAGQTKAQAQGRPLLQTQSMETGSAVTLSQDLQVNINNININIISILERSGAEKQEYQVRNDI